MGFFWIHVQFGMVAAQVAGQRAIILAKDI